MPTLIDVQTRTDGWIAPALPLLDAWQDTRPFPFQGLDSHTTPPTHVEGGGPKAGDTLADRLQDMPTDQPENWEDLPQPIIVALTVQKWPAMARIDVYEGPLGIGFTVTLTFIHEGLTYTRVYNFGPETWREQGWEVADL